MMSDGKLPVATEATAKTLLSDSVLDKSGQGVLCKPFGCYTHVKTGRNTQQQGVNDGREVIGQFARMLNFAETPRPGPRGECLRRHEHAAAASEFRAADGPAG